MLRSYDAINKTQAQLLIMREVFLRFKELNISVVCCMDIHNKWSNLLKGKATIHRENYPVPRDIVSLTGQMIPIQFTARWHPLVRETRKLAMTAAHTRISFSWP